MTTRPEHATCKHCTKYAELTPTDGECRRNAPRWIAKLQRFHPPRKPDDWCDKFANRHV